MPVGKTWAMTQLGRGTSLELQIDIGTTQPSFEEVVLAASLGLDPPVPRVDVRKYDVSQYTSTWAVNEIPNAQCMLAIGRDVRELVKAEIHRSASQLRQMRKARIIFRPQGEFDPDGTPWPAEFVVFDGYFMGLAYNKINGKVQVVANLKHWLIDLACSSCLTRNSHPLNPAQLTARAIQTEIGTTGASEAVYVSNLAGVKLVRQQVIDDTWGGIKRLFCGIASFDTAVGSTDREGNCGGTGNALKNDRARRALLRMEGPGRAAEADCTRDYVYGVPLFLDLLNVRTAEDAVARAITDASVTSYANTTFWDKLVGEYCPAFGMAVVPAVDYALVIADTPAFRGGPWKTIEPGEYDSFSMQADLERPLRAVGVIVQHAAYMGAAEGSPGQAIQQPSVGGCFAADIEDPDDGVIQFVTAPSWLQCLVDYQPYASSTTGLVDNSPSRTDTTPAAAGSPPPPPSGKLSQDVNRLINQHAQSVFVLNMLRGRSGTVGGKLRFDIAPGSLIRVRGSEEKFLAGEDELATNIIGCVSRMTIAINADSSVAGTTFQLSHLRTEAENSDDRTSVAQHPLFRRAIHGGGNHGAPLVVGHEELSDDED